MKIRVYRIDNNVHTAIKTWYSNALNNINNCKEFFSSVSETVEKLRDRQLPTV